MVSKMLGPTAVTASALSKRAGVGQPTLSKWLREAKMSVVSKKSKDKGSVSGAAQPVRSAADKLRVIVAAAQLDEAGLGQLLRREGLHESDLEAFRAEALSGLSAEPARPASANALKEIKQLRRDLERKQKALREAEALLVLRKKLNALWGSPEGGADSGTEEKSD
jgi:transposase